MVKKKNGKNFIVVFQDEKGNVLKTSFVNEGDEAQPPQIPEKIETEEEHYEKVFTHWDSDFGSISSNIVIKPIYEKRLQQFLVMYFDWNGKILGTETVEYGNPARAEIIPRKKGNARYEYKFISWSIPLDEIKQDVMAKAQYEEIVRQYRIRYYSAEKDIVKEELVPYGMISTPPELVEKKSDRSYEYRFTGWTEDVSLPVAADMDIFSQFEAIPIEYHLQFLENDEIIEEYLAYYGDSIVYPTLKKKGYRLSWNPFFETVEDDAVMKAQWTFAYNKGSEFLDDKKIGVFKIINPSIHNGTVCCISCSLRDEEIIKLPEKVKLGEYYYQITEIGEAALFECRGMKKLILPDSVEVLHQKALAYCKSLKTIQCGKRLSEIEKEVFAGNIHLSDLILSGNKLKKANRFCFKNLKQPLNIMVRAEKYGAYKRLFQGHERNGRIRLKKY